MFCEHVLGFDAEDLIRDPDGRVICQGCAEWCEQCGRQFFRDAMVKTQEGYFLCRGCNANR